MRKYNKNILLKSQKVKYVNIFAYSLESLIYKTRHLFFNAIGKKPDIPNVGNDKNAGRKALDTIKNNIRITKGILNHSEKNSCCSMLPDG